jgi:hypothetical protein
MPPEELERDELYFLYLILRVKLSSFGPQAMRWYGFFGDNSTALSEYRRALTLSRDEIDRLPKMPSTRRVREHHVVELVLNGHWELDPIRREEASHDPSFWRSHSEGAVAFDGKLSTITLPSLYHRSAYLVEVERISVAGT